MYCLYSCLILINYNYDFYFSVFSMNVARSLNLLCISTSTFDNFPRFMDSFDFGILCLRWVFLCFLSRMIIVIVVVSSDIINLFTLRLFHDSWISLIFFIANLFSISFIIYLWMFVGSCSIFYIKIQSQKAYTFKWFVCNKCIVVFFLKLSIIRHSCSRARYLLSIIPRLVIEVAIFSVVLFICYLIDWSAPRH